MLNCNAFVSSVSLLVMTLTMMLWTKACLRDCGQSWKINFLNLINKLKFDAPCVPTKDGEH